MKFWDFTVNYGNYHSTRYVLNTSTFTDEMLGIYVVNHTAAAVSIECEEYRQMENKTRWSILGVLEPGQKMRMKRIPDYFFEEPSEWDVSWFDLGVHRVYYCLKSNEY